MDGYGYATSRFGQGGTMKGKGRAVEPGVIGQERAGLQGQQHEQQYMDDGGDSPGGVSVIGQTGPVARQDSAASAAQTPTSSWMRTGTYANPPTYAHAYPRPAEGFEQFGSFYPREFTSPASTDGDYETDFPALANNEQDANGRNSRVATVDLSGRHARVESAFTVSTQAEHEDYYEPAGIPTRSRMAAVMPPATESPPWSTMASHGSMSSTELITQDQEEEEMETLKKITTAVARSASRHAQMIAGLHDLTENHGSRITLAEDQIAQINHRLQTMQLEISARFSGMPMGVPQYPQHPNFEAGPYSHPGAIPPSQQGPQSPNAQVVGGTHNPSDDVFGPGPVMRPHVAQYEQKDYPELMRAVFVKVEAVVRQYLVAPMSTRSEDEYVKQVVSLAAMHLDSRRMAIIMLEDGGMRMPLVTGIMNRFLINEVYMHPLIATNVTNTHFAQPNVHLAREYLAAWDDEVRGSSNAFTANDYPRRAALADKRAHLTRRIIDGQNFYKWQLELTHRLTEKLVLQVLPLFRQDMIPQAKSDLYRAVNEAVKITIRMRKEVKVLDYGFYRYGNRWDTGRMVQRNPELMGQACNEHPPIWVVRTTMAPYMVEKTFVDGGYGGMSIRHLLKGEVTLCDRAAHLR